MSVSVPVLEEVAAGAALLRAGGLLAIPTETVYGLAADATNASAVRRIFEVKGRPINHPLIVHVASASDLERWVARVDPRAERLASAFWPGPLTLVLPRASAVLDEVTGGLDTVAIRVPDHPATRGLIAALGSGVAAPSANRFGQLSPTRAEHVIEELGPYLDPQRDAVFRGEPCAVGVESTIVDLSSEQPVLLRPGGLAVDVIEACLGCRVLPFAGGVARAPGQLPSHYAPRAKLLLCEPARVGRVAEAAWAGGARVAVLSEADVNDLPQGVAYHALPTSAEARARELYGTLRALDRAGYEVVVVGFRARDGLDLAVADRLSRAAAPRPE